MHEVTQKQYLECLNRLAATDDGRVVLSHIKDLCKWDSTILSSDEPVVTQYHAARRGVYGTIRQGIKAQHLKEIEFNYTFKPTEAGTNDRRSTSSTNRSTTSKPRAGRSTS